MFTGGTLLSKERRVGYSDHLSILLKMFMFSNMAQPYDKDLPARIL